MYKQLTYRKTRLVKCRDGQIDSEGNRFLDSTSKITEKFISKSKKSNLKKKWFLKSKFKIITQNIYLHLIME